MKTDPLIIFKQLGWFKDDLYTDEGLWALAKLIEKLPEIHKTHYGPLFEPLVSRVVPATIELIIVRDGQVLLTYRKDKHYDGYHTPGSHIGPREEWQDAAQRTAQTELGCSVRVVKYLTSFNVSDNERLHVLSNLVLCELNGEPKQGEWFSKQPPQMLQVQKRFWPVIESVLHDSPYS